MNALVEATKDHADEHRLVLIVRNDLPEMSPGRVAAQCAHAGHVLDQRVHQLHKCGAVNGSMLSYYHNWQQQNNALSSQPFGKTVVLTGDSMDIGWIISEAWETGDAVAGWVVDNSYPMGDTTIIAFTVGFLFLPKGVNFERLNRLPLYN